MARLHATCVAIGGRGVLLTGPSGAGKSDLALRLIDRGAVLVSDDGVDLNARDGRLEAAAPRTIAGLMEVRGLGIVPVESVRATVALVIALDRSASRMPESPLPTQAIDGIAIPLIALSPFETSAPIKVERALGLFGLAP